MQDFLIWDLRIPRNSSTTGEITSGGKSYLILRHLHLAVKANIADVRICTVEGGHSLRVFNMTRLACPA